ncbi:MAG: hypothetical protein QM695_10400 [Micropruina sp.]
MGLSLLLQGSGAVLAYASQLVMARVLGAGPFGSVSAIVGISALVGLALTLGGGGLALRLLPRWYTLGDRSRCWEFLVGFWCAILVCSAVLLGLVWLLAGSGLEGGLAASGVILSMLTAFWTFGGDAGRAVGRFASTYGLSLVVRPALTILTVVILVRAVGLQGAAAGMAALCAGGVVAVVVQMLVLARAVRPEAAPVVREVGLWRGWWRQAPHYLMANGFVLMLLQVDLLMSATLLSPVDLGHYAAASKSASVLLVVSAAVGTVVVPRLSLYSDDVRMLALEAASATRWQLMLVSGPAVVLLIFAGAILSLFGPGFADAALPLQVMVLGQLINMAFGPGGTLLVYTGHPKVATWGYGVATVVSGAACALGIVMWGLLGAAVGSALGVASVGAIMWLLARHKTGVGGSVYAAAKTWIRR